MLEQCEGHEGRKRGTYKFDIRNLMDVSIVV